MTSEPLIAQGRLLASQGKLQEARDVLLEALEVLKLHENRYALATCLEAISALPGIALHTAARLLGKAKAIREKEAFGIPLSERHLIEPIVGNLQSQLGDAAFDLAFSEGGKLTYEQAVETASKEIKSLA